MTSSTLNPTAQDGAKIAICMGSQSDWETMRHAKEILETLNVPCDCRIISAHRTPDRLTDFAKGAARNGFHVIIAVLAVPRIYLA